MAVGMHLGKRVTIIFLFILCAIICGPPDRAIAEPKYQVYHAIMCDNTLSMWIKEKGKPINSDCYILVNNCGYTELKNIICSRDFDYNFLNEADYPKSDNMSNENIENTNSKWKQCKVKRREGSYFISMPMEGGKPETNLIDPIKVFFSISPFDYPKPEYRKITLMREPLSHWRSALHHIWMYPLDRVALPLSNPDLWPSAGPIAGLFADIDSILENDRDSLCGLIRHRGQGRRR